MPSGAGWRGASAPLQVGIGYTAREVCDGQSSASLGQWAAKDRRYPEHAEWKTVADLLIAYLRKHGNSDLLMRLALGKVIIDALAQYGLHLESSTKDRDEVLVDYRLMELFLAAARDPEVHLGSFAAGVRLESRGAVTEAPSALQGEEEVAAAGASHAGRG